MEVVLQIVILVLGFVLLIKGADFFVEGASQIADRFGIPQLVIGLTIVAMGTSLPEAAVSISAAAKGSAEITIGNVLGSNIINVLLILGVTAVIRTISVQVSTIRYEIPFVILVTVVLAALGLIDHNVSRAEGAILWVFFICYGVYLYIMSKKGNGQEEEGEETGKKHPIWLLVVMIIGGAAMIVFGSNLAVDSASALAAIFGMSQRLIGLTIVAFGTSLPELVTSATAAVKGKADIAVGNIVGSNIFNILFVAGTTALITPVAYSGAFLTDSIVAIATAVLLLICVFPRQRLSRVGGAVLLLGYAGYFAYLIH